MKKKNSISLVFARHQAISVLVLLLFIVANSVLIYFTERHNAVSEREYQMQLAASEVNARIGVLEDNIKETITTIMNNYGGLWTVENDRKYFDKQQLSRFIAAKRILMNELQFFFALRPGDFTVFQADETSSIFDRLEIKEYMEQNAAALFTGANDSEWTVCEIRDRQYMVICYYYAYADIYVGVALEPKLLLREILELAEIDRGTIQVTDVHGNTFTYGSVAESIGSSIDIRSVNMRGHFELEATFNTNNLGFLKNNLLLGVLVGFVLCVAAMVYMNRLLSRTVIRPIKELSAALENIENPVDEKKVPENAEVYEIHRLESSINSLLGDVIYNRMRLYSAQIEKAEQELNMLRAQLRPHFFLNAITTVNAMTYQDRSEDIRTYLMKLSSFIRYTISSSVDMVSVGEEILNVDNYFQMQEIRYPGRVMTFIDCAQEIQDVCIPRFMLLTIVENAFKYAMRVDDMIQIYIQCIRCEEEDFSGIAVTIEDNGNGFTQEQIEFYNRPELNETTEDVHIGITNVKRTLALYYGRSDLLKLSNTVPTGARIEIRIPFKEQGKGGAANEGAYRG